MLVNNNNIWKWSNYLKLKTFSFSYLSYLPFSSPLTWVQFTLPFHLPESAVHSPNPLTWLLSAINFPIQLNRVQITLQSFYLIGGSFSQFIHLSAVHSPIPLTWECRSLSHSTNLSVVHSPSPLPECSPISQAKSTNLDVVHSSIPLTWVEFTIQVHPFNLPEWSWLSQSTNLSAIHSPGPHSESQQFLLWNILFKLFWYYFLFCTNPFLP